MARARSVIWMAAMLWVAFHSLAMAQVSLTNFKAGAYRGTLQVTVAVADLGETKTTVRVVGRSEGDSTLRFVAPPQVAQPILSSTDDFPVKFFSLTSIATFMVLREGRLIFEGGQDRLESSTDPYISKFVKLAPAEGDARARE